MRARYGASVWHLLGQLAVLGVSAYAIGQMLERPSAVNFLAWLLAGALLHDLVFLPLYSLADRALRRLTRVNYVRVPALIAGVLLLCFWPLIVAVAPGNYRRSTGHELAGYGRDWVLLTVALFVGSALVYAIRRYRA